MPQFSVSGSFVPPDRLHRVDHGTESLRVHVIRDRITRTSAVTRCHRTELCSSPFHFFKDMIVIVHDQLIHVKSAEKPDLSTVKTDPFFKWSDLVFVGVFGIDAQRDDVGHQFENLPRNCATGISSLHDGQCRSPSCSWAG